MSFGFASIGVAILTVFVTRKAYAMNCLFLQFLNYLSKDLENLVRIID